EKNGQRGHDGTRQRFVDGYVHDRERIGLAHTAEILALAVEHDDGIVDGETENSHQRSQHGEIEIQLEQREHAGGENYVMGQGDDSAGRQLPMEADHDVNQDAYDGVQQRQTALAHQLVTHLGANEFDALQLDAGHVGPQSRQNAVAD